MKHQQSEDSGNVYIEKNCSRYRTCSAPLCPFDKDIAQRLWYPNEPICTARQFKFVWIKNQQKLRKRAIDKSRYFILEMLNRNYRIRTGIKGLHPDPPQETEKKRLKTWLKKHPAQKKIIN